MLSSNTAVFVIDIQHDLLGDSQTEIPYAARIKDAGTQILSAVRQLNASSQKPSLVVFVQHEEPAESGSLVRGSEAWQLVFPPQSGLDHEILVSKTTRDTFETNPGLATELKARGIDKIVAFGIQSECCVQSTCMGALDAGFQVTVLKGAHSTYHGSKQQAEEIERSVEELLRSRGAEVVEWEEEVRSWSAGVSASA
ncbi:Isochorismatase-like protein [Stachybotrys elegans]|uniref:Isochorismatase-like protein n=1 Tax=Stachybotrys elegans TaxID=80388 RepID=A0A8K0SWB8_9HYPO|nr:Isochorismatase-like protein [Stachybotrys elegans]